MKYLKIKLEKGGRALERRADSAGYDCYPRIGGMIGPLERQIIPLGFATEFDPDYVGLLWDRSGVGAKGVTRFAGVIDASYRGEWKAVLWNSTPTTFGFDVSKPIIQCVFVPFGSVNPVIVEALTLSERGTGCMGSSDKFVLKFPLTDSYFPQSDLENATKFETLADAERERQNRVSPSDWFVRSVRDEIKQKFYLRFEKSNLYLGIDGVTLTSDLERRCVFVSYQEAEEFRLKQGQPEKLEIVHD